MNNKAASLFLASILAFTATAHAQEACTIRQKEERKQATVLQFKRAYPCPGEQNAYQRAHLQCPGYVVDHIIPLCACGRDHIENLQWQTKADAAAKDVLERQQCAALRKERGEK